MNKRVVPLILVVEVVVEDDGSSTRYFLENSSTDIIYIIYIIYINDIYLL